MLNFLNLTRMTKQACINLNHVITRAIVFQINLIILAPTPLPSIALRSGPAGCPKCDMFYGHSSVPVTLDTGATGSMLKHSTALALGIKVMPTRQGAHQADGDTPLNTVGEASATFHRDGMDFHFEGLVVTKLYVDILAGNPFLEDNDISVRPAKRLITFRDGSTVTYGGTSKPGKHQVRLTGTCLLRSPPTRTTVWPGSFLELDVPYPVASEGQYVAVEPRIDTSHADLNWPKTNIYPCIAGKVRLPNLTDNPIVISRNSHICQVASLNEHSNPDTVTHPPVTNIPLTNPKPSGPFSDTVSVDPDHILPEDIRSKFRAVNLQYDEVFNPDISCYNGASGPFQGKVHMGPVEPPQRKGRVPEYSHDKLVELQNRIDELHARGVLARPEDVNIDVEYVNPCFLVKQPNKVEKRFVTAFPDVARYCKPQPSLMADTDTTIRRIASWRYIIATDFKSAFFQIPLSRDSMKYCGIASPFKGTFVYQRCAMGMPGSETALEELTCRVLGELVEEGILAKIADDVYVGGDTPSELLINWTKFLEAMHRNNLRAKGIKTIIAPLSTVILGWLWKQGTLSATTHRISTLSTCDQPKTVRNMKSFLGACKFLARVLPRCSMMLAPLDSFGVGYIWERAQI